jgi:hypothetical protein
MRSWAGESSTSRDVPFTGSLHIVQLGMVHGLPHDGHAVAFAGMSMEHRVQVRSKPKATVSDMKKSRRVKALHQCYSIEYYSDARPLSQKAWTVLAAYDANPIYIVDLHKYSCGSQNGRQDH